MGKRLDLTGQRFGRLVVLGFDHMDKYHRSIWKCQCICGTIKIVAGYHLRSEHTKSCGCLQQSSLVGQRFGMLVVLEQAGYGKQGRSFWKCQCDCKKIKIVSRGSLKKGNVKSCGCLRRLPFGESGFNRILRNCKNGAKERNYNFQLSRKYFRELCGQKCFYCGAKPSNICKDKGQHGEYIYQGIDRVDNSRGYVEGNVVACCAMCNRMKLAYSQKEFLEHVARIAKYQKSKK